MSFGRPQPRGRSLWDSYNVAIGLISKTYARDGTSNAVKVPADSRRHALRWRAAGWGPETGRTSSRNEEKFMMDILMLALGFGFFALAIGYTYACERL